jgi:uncharacterized protein (DUF1330 family)
MAGYAIAEVDITDPALFEQYRSQVVPTIEKYGGRVLVRGGPSETREGDWRPRRLVVVEFESVARAREWYESPEYAPLIELRKRAAKTQLVIVEGN